MSDENFIRESLQVGNINGLETALTLAELQKESNGDLDYFIVSLKALIREKKEA